MGDYFLKGTEKKKEKEKEKENEKREESSRGPPLYAIQTADDILSGFGHAFDRTQGADFPGTKNRGPPFSLLRDVSVGLGVYRD
jgi:hypothetical protein